MIQRRLSEHILQSLKQYPAVGLVGPRQSGKTTLARMIAKEYEHPSVYIDLERPSDLRKLENAEMYLEQYTDRLVILDEAQRKPLLFPLIRSLIDQDRKAGRFLILGSASPDLKRQSSESLAGRISYHELSPLTLDEVGSSDENMQNNWTRGGYPNSFLAQSDRLASDWLNNFIQTHLEREIPNLGIRILFLQNKCRGRN